MKNSWQSAVIRFVTGFVAGLFVGWFLSMPVRLTLALAVGTGLAASVIWRIRS